MRDLARILNHDWIEGAAKECRPGGGGTRLSSQHLGGRGRGRQISEFKASLVYRELQDTHRHAEKACLETHTHTHTKKEEEEKKKMKEKI